MTGERVFLKNREWRDVEGEICRVTAFTPLAGRVKEGRVVAMDRTAPYASVELECSKLTGKAKGFICQKIDFAMLWAAFKEPRRIAGVRTEVADDFDARKEEHEVWIVWTEKRYGRLAGLLKAVLPRLIVMICPAGAYELATDPSHRPDLEGLARFLAERPLVTWTPEVMTK